MSLAKIFWFFLLFMLIRALLSRVRIGFYQRPVRPSPPPRSQPPHSASGKKTIEAEYKVISQD